MGRIFQRFIGLVVLTGFLTGCGGSALKLDGATIGKIQNRKLALVVAPPPKMIIMTPEKSMNGGGILGYLLVNGLSDDLAKDYGITDPARLVGQKIQRKLAAKHHMVPASSAKKADVLLQVSTAYWEVGHGALAFTSYFPRMNVSIKLVDRRTNTVLSDGTCVNTKAVTKVRGYDEILQNNGAVLKKDLNQMAERCARKMLAKL